MKGKIANTTSNETNKKPISNNRLKSLGAAMVFTASVLSTNLGYSDMTEYTQLGNLKKKDTPEWVNKEEHNKILDTQDTLPTDTIDHAKYLEYPIDRVVDKFWEEKALEIIQYNLLSQINSIRKELGVDTLTLDKHLVTASQLYAEEMAKTKKFSHTGKNGSDATQRAKKAWYDAKRFVGENIWWNYYSIEKAMEERKKSPPHFDKIKNQNRKYLWIGYCDGYRVLMFWN